MRIKARSKKLRGWLTFEFQPGGLLAYFDNKLKGGLTEAQVRALSTSLPRHVDELPQLERIGFELTRVATDDSGHPDSMAPSKAPNPVAIWCAGYNAHHTTTYMVSGAEVGILQSLGDLVTPALVEQYMVAEDWWAKPKSVAGFAKHINQVRELVAKAGQGVKDTAAAQREERFRLTSRLEAISMEARKLRNAIEGLQHLHKENEAGGYLEQAEAKQKELESLMEEASEIGKKLKAL